MENSKPIQNDVRIALAVVCVHLKIIRIFFA